MNFNPATPNIMHIDLNSCFASVEQQANPLLRDKPIAVVHSDAPYGCILAPSVEAKLWGIKTGMNLKEGKDLCPWLIARVADPDKYREVHAKFAKLLDDYSDHIIPKSIDEFVLTLPVPKGSDLDGCAQPRLDIQRGRSDPIGTIAAQIKSRIKKEIGDYLRVSIGVSTNQVLAKLASGLHKPDGFDIIDHTNFMDIYDHIPLQELCGINVRNEARLHRVGIFTVRQFYESDIQTLKSAFESILGRYWYTRLRGYEVDDIEFNRRSFGQSYVLPHPMDLSDWRPILAKLVAKAARRLRKYDCSATAVHLYLRFGDGTSWHAGHQLHHSIFTDHELLDAALSLQSYDSSKKVKKIAVTFFGLEKDNGQLSCLRDLVKEKSLAISQDQINDKWGEYTLSYGSFLGSTGHVRDAIAFGK
jgi:DNA polymerase-4